MDGFFNALMEFYAGADEIASSNELGFFSEYDPNGKIN